VRQGRPSPITDIVVIDRVFRNGERGGGGDISIYHKNTNNIGNHGGQQCQTIA